MGCPTLVDLGDSLVFSVTTHDPDTGVLTDADSNPTYRVYEDETAVPILTGTMTPLDAGSTTGFYTESIDCTVANGFEAGRTYTVYIEATVDADTGGITYGFKVYRLCTLGAGAIEETYTLTDSGTGAPIPDADIWVTSDVAGNWILASGRTDQFGQVTFWLDAGTVYVWRQKSGWNFTNPDVEVVAP